MANSHRLPGASGKASLNHRKNHNITRDTYQEFSRAIASALAAKRNGDDGTAAQHGQRVINLLHFHSII